MKKRSIVIVLALTFVLTLALTATAVAKIIYWEPGDKVTCMVNPDGTVDISWPSTATPVEAYNVIIRHQGVHLWQGHSPDGTLATTMTFDASDYGDGHYTVTIRATDSTGTIAFDVLRGGGFSIKNQ